MKKNTQKGFTLVELLVVIAILAILASVSVVGYTAFISKADKQAASTEMDQIQNIINHALIVEDEVKLTVSNTDLYLTKNGNTVAINTTKQSTDDVTNITSDIPAKLLAKLTYTEGTLTYKYKTDSTGNDYTLNLAATTTTTTTTTTTPTT